MMAIDNIAQWRTAYRVFYGLDVVRDSLFGFFELIFGKSLRHFRRSSFSGVFSVGYFLELFRIEPNLIDRLNRVIGHLLFKATSQILPANQMKL